MTTFRDLGVSDEVVHALASRGIESPFPIQVMVIEDATSGRDTLARSKTGSGKTLGFAIPIVDQVDPSAERRPAALVLTPTRELAQQVSVGGELDIVRIVGILPLGRVEDACASAALEQPGDGANSLSRSATSSTTSPAHGSSRSWPSTAARGYGSNPRAWGPRTS